MVWSLSQGRGPLETTKQILTTDNNNNNKSNRRKEHVFITTRLVLFFYEMDKHHDRLEEKPAPRSYINGGLSIEHSNVLKLNCQ